MLLKGKTAIITGGASLKGIGWATAKCFTENGARVALLDLDQSALDAATAELGGNCIGLRCDVRFPDACQQAVESIIKTFGQVDILINNAGVSQPFRLMASTMDDYELVMDVSLRGAFNMSRALVPHLRARRSGVIVNMGSVAAQRGGGVLGGPHYAAAKGGTQTLAKAMARELAPDGIRVNAIAPGLVDTELLVGKLTDEGRQAALAATPLGRLALPKDIADACLFLSSDLSSYVTGVVLDVNGGLHIH
ncbi:SDR family NAD(P)-dependent oxidoreductase [Pseudomonas sp. CHM02]|uniref:SDR family NAD(P)-dependent oxidoreductase n=1 Tax=Pseudomonas sp. CHM02 TaxID=1463662 RepID=UPI000470500B|nr:SDR family NAD(P)-dependent oxidoreductase [Pseudomonas sp. CHM02]